MAMNYHGATTPDQQIRFDARMTEWQKTDERNPSRTGRPQFDHWLRRKYPADHQEWYTQAYVPGAHRGGRPAHICSVTHEKESGCECDTCDYNRRSRLYHRQRNRQRWQPYSKAQHAMLARIVVDGTLLVKWGKDSSRNGRGNGYGVWGQTEMRAYMELKRMGYVADVPKDERNQYSIYAVNYSAAYDDKVTPENRYLNRPHPEFWEPHIDVRLVRATTEAEREQFKAEKKIKVEEARKRRIASRNPATAFSDPSDTDKYRKTKFERDPFEFWGDDHDKWGSHQFATRNTGQ